MKVYSDSLTTDDLYSAARGVCGVWLCDEMPRPRKRKSGWVVSLTGSSPYASQMGDYHKAATWDEHGIWMDRLFQLDPCAVIGFYDGYEDFVSKTQADLDRMIKYHGTPQAGHKAPWLDRVEMQA